MLGVPLAQAGHNLTLSVIFKIHGAFMLCAFPDAATCPALLLFHEEARLSLQ